MSNRDGKSAKRKLHFRAGKLCKRCQKGRYEYCDCRGCRKRNKESIVCKTCGFTNF